MILMTYNAKDGDPERTEVAGVKFRSGIPVELPPHKEWIGRKHLGNGNPWFAVEINPVPDDPGDSPSGEVEQASEPGKE